MPRTPISLPAPVEEDDDDLLEDDEEQLDRVLAELDDDDDDDDDDVEIEDVDHDEDLQFPPPSLDEDDDDDDGPWEDDDLLAEPDGIGEIDADEDEEVAAWDEEPAVPIVPWRTTVTLPVLGQEVSAILDPTREHTEWVVVGPVDRPSVPLTVRVASVQVEVNVRLISGDEPMLRIGRDVLANRILVRS